MPNNDTNPNPRIRPRQVLLVGLGGVGSRTVDRVLSIMPEEYKKYTKAIALDTDIGELAGELSYIPENNRIALGSNPDTRQSITIGDYIRNNPSTTEWFVKGDKLDTIEKRSTTQGAKQIRMVSRVALAATNDFCGMKNVIEQVIRQFNVDDGSVGGNGLLVMIVCSIAGGTGAGTVLQFPLYLEQAIAGMFSDEDVQIDCSMLLPDMFRRVQSDENYFAGKANAYAVIRELMSINSRKLRRGDIVANADLEVKGEKISPFGRVLFFDSTSMSGDTLNGDLDHVYIPKVATALNEYLFGPVSGKITSALDNTLRRVYDSDGQAIFGSVGTSRLYFPRATYIQYATANWVSKAIAKQWLEADVDTERRFKDEYKKAVENDTDRPTEIRKRELFCEFIDENSNPFYKEIKSSLKKTSGGVQDKKQIPTIVEEFWRNCEAYLTERIAKDVDMGFAYKDLEKSIKAKSDSIISKLESYKAAVDKVKRIGYIYEKKVMCPPEAENGTIYNDYKDTSSIYNFIREKKLHPLMIRYFLYRLYMLAKQKLVPVGDIKIDRDELKSIKKFKAFADEINDTKAKLKKAAVIETISNFAEHLIKDLDVYIEEYEDMFKQLDVVVESFDKKKNTCMTQLPLINDESGTILAGGQLSMMYTWRKIEDEISAGEDVYTIDDELDEKIHEIVYSSFVKQIVDLANVKHTLQNGKKLKIRTRYEEIMSRELQSYYARKININYTHCFPKNVIEAALLECGLRNAYKRDSQDIDATVGFNHAMFIDRNPIPYNIQISEDGYVTDAAYLENLLNSLLGKGKPFCGRVESVGGEAPILSRLLTINRSMLRTKEDSTNIDENGIPKVIYLEDEIIEGVSSSRIGNINVNTKFVETGITSDEIISVSTVAGLEPKAFVSFLPPDDNEHSPTKEQSYYSAYSEFVNGLTSRKSSITPHLHWKWHMAGMLADITEDHTDTYSKQAAEAFMYGFIFDLITVGNDGIVTIGKLGDPIFAEAFKGESVEEFTLLLPHEHANVDKMQGEEKRNMMNTLLVKIYELLSTSTTIRAAIITYCEKKMQEFEESNSPEFVGLCLNTESIDNVRYMCILDVLIGYYKGTRHMSAADVIRADKNVGYMFYFLLAKTYEVAKHIAFKDNSDVKETYGAFVNMYYKTAEGDDPVGAVTVSTESITELVDGADKEDQIKGWLSQITSAMPQKTKNPFGEGIGNRYSIDSALVMVDTFMDNEK